MNWLDIVILVILAVSVVGGWVTGLVKSILSWVGFVVGIVLAGGYYARVGALLYGIFQESLAKVLGFVLIFLAVVVISLLVAAWLSKLIANTPLNWLNRIGGAAFGLFFSAVIVGSLITLLVKFAGMEETVQQSAIASLLVSRFPLIFTLLPEEFGPVKTFFK